MREKSYMFGKLRKLCFHLRRWTPPAYFFEPVNAVVIPKPT
jgi:hypothetical protein